MTHWGCGVRALVLPFGALFCILSFSCHQSAGAGGLSGIVRDAATLQPIEGAMIVALPDSGGPVASGRSGPDGRFSITSSFG